MTVVPVALGHERRAAVALLAARCGVRTDTVLLAGLALLLRRYTGRAAHPLTCGGRRRWIDVGADGPVGDLLTRVHGAQPGPGPAGPLSTVELMVEPLGLGGVPDELAPFLVADYATLLGALADAETTADLLPVAAYERPPAVDRAALHAPGAPPCRLPPGDTIPAVFAAQVARHPDAPAVLADDGDLTYRELAAAALATAARLGDGGPVAMLCRHGAASVVGLLGALVAGRPYVPLDPTFPVPRLAAILADSAASALLTDDPNAALAAQVALAAGAAPAIVHIGAPGDGTAEDLTGAILARPDDPAYVLYTSGSTGTPKGVVQSHRNVLAGIAAHVRNFAVTPADRTSVLTSFGYDMAVTDTFGALLSGAAAVPVDVRTHGLRHLARTLADRGVTVYHSTPTVYRYLVASLGADGRLPAVRAVLLGGEEVTRHDVTLARRHFAPDAVFVNGYGTTEISFATQHHLSPAAPVPDAVVPIGQPLDGIDVVLVDDAGRATCLTGEVVVRAPHVALGYHGLPDLTADRFVVRDGVRAYRTGDLARRRPDGTLAYLGRADRLVKIRGNRVELGEVEAHLAALPGVGRAAVVAPVRADRPGEKEILGYVVPAAGAEPQPAALREALAAALPEFMVPRTVVVVAALPIGPTGKLDVAALPPPPDVSTVDEEAVGDPVERAVAAAWCDVLGLPAVDRNTSFVALGGHSLLMALVQQRLDAALDRRIPLAVMYEHPTVAALASHLSTATPAPAPGPAPAEPAQTSSDVIAVVGLACRVPGADDPDTLWRNLIAGVDGIRRYTPAELDAAGAPGGPGWVPAFGHLDALTDVDATLFGYTDAEAALLDPQHRLFLEVAWWALEDAAIDPDRTEDQIGVFAGCGPDRYLRHHLLGNPAVGAAVAAETVSAEDWDDLLAGGTPDYLATRVAYALGLTGPAVGVQTACSSSLVAVCQAAQSLLDFRCDVAIAGGAAVVSTRQAGYRYRPGGTYATDGVCRPYDAAATGQVFGNGAGAVVLRRLADALADGDHVYAVLPGWAVTNDGAARAGFTVPGVGGQAAAVVEALAVAGWDPADVGFVEGHGTGTAVGDAIEVEALTRAFRSGAQRAAPRVLGSVKGNLGNLDAAAGVVGLIKAVLAVGRGAIPGTAHFTRPHPDVDLAGGLFEVSAKAREWLGPRRAGVSSFGIGGTNAHVLVAQPPGAVEPAAGETVAPHPVVLHLSAATPDALRALAARLADLLRSVDAPPLADVAHTLAVGRRRLAHRATVACADLPAAVAALDVIAAAAPGAAGSADLDDPPAGRRIPLPGYPFRRRRHWIDAVR